MLIIYGGNGKCESKGSNGLGKTTSIIPISGPSGGGSINLFVDNSDTNCNWDMNCDGGGTSDSEWPTKGRYWYSYNRFNCWWNIC